MSEELSGEFSRCLAREFLGERKGRSVSQIVEDNTGISKGAFHVLLALGIIAYLNRNKN